MSMTAVYAVAIGATIITGLMSTCLALFITRREVESQKAETDRRIDELSAVLKADSARLETTVAEDRRSATVSRARLHDRIDALKDDFGREIGGLRTYVAEQNAVVTKDLGNRINALPWQVITLLKNAGAAKPNDEN